MTMIIEDGNSDYDGSGVPSTAAGPIVVTFSGTLGASGDRPILTLFSRSDTAEFTPTYSTELFDRFRVNLAAGDNYYFKVKDVDADASVDLSVVSI